MNESECFNKLVDPVPETYIGLEPDGLYKECRQVNFWKPCGSYGTDLYDDLKTFSDWVAEKYSNYFWYL